MYFVFICHITVKLAKITNVYLLLNVVSLSVSGVVKFALRSIARPDLFSARRVIDRITPSPCLSGTNEDGASVWKVMHAKVEVMTMCACDGF